jgi:glyoxylase-like metal-dependent hydrolase (beta-lactamase superfamily II)
MAELAWDEPGVEQVLDGVFRVPLPLPNDGLRAVNVYVIDDGDGLVLVDGGWALAESQAQLERGLASIDHKLADIRDFLVTHAHRDHYTQATAIRRLHGSRVQIGAGERHTLELLTQPLHQPFDTMTRRLESAGAAAIWSQFEKWRDEAERENVVHNIWELPDVWLEPGLLTLSSRQLEVIQTPGHTAGHVVFHDRGHGALFAGDHVLPRITPSIGLEPGSSTLPLAAYLESLRRMLELPDGRLLPAHGPVTDSVHARVHELLEHHERRLTLSAAAVDAGADTAYEAARALRWTRHERQLDDMDLFNQILAIGETRVHLDVCVARGWLTSSTDDAGVIRYRRA